MNKFIELTEACFNEKMLISVKHIISCKSVTKNGTLINLDNRWINVKEPYEYIKKLIGGESE
ncbi:hypothetical protein RCS94_06670 [Orbaceae bacterium ac157xtp]